MASSPAHTSQTNAQATVGALLRQLKVPVTSQTIRQTLRQHPDFPSLLSISDALDEWQVDNAAIQLGHVEQLSELPTPFVVHSTKEGGLYLLIEAITNGTVTSLEPGSRHRQTEPEAQFAKHWSGVVLMAEKNGQSGEVDYQANRKKELMSGLRWSVIFTTLFIVLLLVLISVTPILLAYQWLWLGTKLIGLAISVALVLKQLGHTHSLTDRLCSTISKTGCDGILNSPAAIVLGEIHWSDVGLVYFVGGLFAGLLGSFLPGIWPLLSVLALLALPYTAFSLYYQARIARQWCMLCLCVQAVLLTEGLLTLAQPIFLPAFNQVYGWFGSAFLISVAIWAILKPLLQQATESDLLRQQLNRFKNNPALFSALITMQPKSPNWLPENVVTLGDSTSQNTLTVVIDPFCSSCIALYQRLSQFAERGISLKIQLIFTSCDERSAQFLHHLVALNDETKVQLALASWFGEKRMIFSVWATQFRLQNEQDEINYADLVRQYCQWQQEAGIQGTPVIYFNSFQLPTPFKLNDLIAILPRLEVVHQPDYSLSTNNNF